MPGPIVGGLQRFLGVGPISAATLEHYVRAAEAHCDARTMAFAAANMPDGTEALRLADKAVGLSPQLTWIYVLVCPKVRWQRSDLAARREEIIHRLEAWDPDNATPYLLEASGIAGSRGAAFPSFFQFDRLASESAWCAAMAKAFAAPRYDSYSPRWFDLSRAWLREHGRATPNSLIYESLTVGPGLHAVAQAGSYADVLNKELGKKAEQAGRTDEALADYWSVAHMGERLQVQGDGSWEQMLGGKMRIDAYERLVPLLRNAGRAEEAATLSNTVSQLRPQQDVYRGKDAFAQSTNLKWTGLLVQVFAGLLTVSVLALLLTMLYLLEQWARPGTRLRLYRHAVVAVQYLPAVLFLACLGFYLGYYPYAANFHHYMTATGEVRDLEPLLWNVLPSRMGPPGNSNAALGNPFWPYAAYALAGLVVEVLVGIPLRRRASLRKERTGPTENREAA